MNTRLSAASLCFAAALAHASWAQCTEMWLPGANADTGFNGMVHSVMPWDPDGPGPQPEVLLVGGDFSARGSTPMPGHLAKFDGTTWSAFTPAPQPKPYELVVFRGELIAAGAMQPPFTSTMSALARWNGTTWTPLGGGVDSMVRALAVHDDTLYVGGELDFAGQVPVSRIAAWDGTTWSNVGGGVTGTFFPMVLALASHADGLIVGGIFTAAGGVPASHVARWDGQQWHAMASGRPDFVECLHVHEGEVYAGSGTIAVWRSGDWDTLTPGVNQVVRSMTTYRGDLVAAGFFTNAGGTPANRIATWDGQSWNALGSGLAGVAFGTANVERVGVFNDTLVVGGFFDTAGNAPSLNFAAWEGPCAPACDTIDFNRDSLFPDTLDVDDFLSVFAGGPCSNDPNCGDVDFNNDSLFPDTTDIEALLRVFAGGSCG
jgi:hypothetical protein